MNKNIYSGRFTADPELKKTPSGISVCTFVLAVRRPHTSDKTDFISFVAWRNTAEFICQHFQKGKMIAVSGFLTSRKYEDAAGNKRVAFEVVVEEAEFCGDKAVQASDPANQLSQPVGDPGRPATASNDQPGDDDLPF